MKKYAFFVGCTIAAALPHIEMMARKVLPLLDIELRDFPFTCCPNSDFRSTDEFSWLVAAARNLAIAEKEDLDILCLCPGCTQTLKEARTILRDDQCAKAQVNKKLNKIGLQFEGVTEVHHHGVLLHRQIDILRKRIVTPLHGIKLAIHPSCHMLMPSSVMEFDNPEQPKKMEELLHLLGATVIDYEEKNLCCGFRLFSSYRQTASLIMRDKVESAAKAGAEAFVVACPSCYQQLDRNQLVAKRELKFESQLPVFYYLQLVGLAMGLSLNEVGYASSRIKSTQVEKKLGASVTE